ncbi:PREDICTED: uncharacterized protein LOC108777630 [Cyphomyrmex costatus]|uniref:uncharacterized protein LOC108777630 n=1 Tax=Cyphomyrmex costatus TaxID=456900 RepID=UPI0008523780|nr:PREDICTED: uncharacterized protein LOC108777630 [Cyphomyrmex costatus]
MSADINALLTAQSDIHGRMARSVSNLKKMGAANNTLHAAETRLTLLEQLWAKFERQHELIRAHYKEAFDESEYSTTLFADSAEITYVQQRSLLNDYMTNLKVEPSNLTLSTEPGNDLSTKSTLPRLKIRSFSGAFEDWLSFRDIFLSIVGNNPSVSNVEKFHHLKYCLQGSAETLIRPLTVTGDNYMRAWALLCKHYENKRELSRSNFCTLTAVHKMKSDTAEELSRIYNAAICAVNGQESIRRPINSHGFDLFNHVIIELFDPRTRLEWESHTSDSTDLPDHEMLMDFIAKRTLTLKAAKPKPNKISEDPPRNAKSHVANKRTADAPGCVLCKGKHNVMMCEQFKAKSASERKSVAETYRLCYNCLGSHTISKCRSVKTCITCKARHHSLLHDAYIPPTPSEASALSAVRRNEDYKAILLATARLSVDDRHGIPLPVRALIDQGSEVSLISEALVQRLRLPRSRAAVSIFGIGGSQSGFSRGKVSLKLTSQVNGAQVSAVAFILPRLSLYQGAPATSKSTWPHIKGLQLADPQFRANDPIELLLGAEVCSTILKEGLRKGDPQDPVAQCTLLGWILSGGCNEDSSVTPRRSLQCTVDFELAALVQRFWEQEKEPSAPVVFTPDEQACEEIFVRTHKRTASGRYVMRLPFASSPTPLSDTRLHAERLLTAMERKCERDARFGELYHAFLREYEELGYMEITPRSLDSQEQAKCYLPHHGVLRESSSSTKLRVVSNGSQSAGSGESLNSQLLTGASLLPSLADVLTRWR